MENTAPDLAKNIRGRLLQDEEKLLSPFATFSENAIRAKRENLLFDRRLDFARDGDRILHSKAYARYIDKTQVFSLCHNDHITHRVLHVQIVSKVARDVGAALSLNTDLIEAIALGHDVGHAPFGHEGELQLRNICQMEGLDPFQHNLHSVRLLKDIERLNLTLQVYDGILCHDGEVHNVSLCPTRRKTWEIFGDEFKRKKKDPALQLTPMTIEACLVRFCDTISYVGRDIEDAIALGFIDLSEIPKTKLGNTNKKIVWILLSDLIRESYGKGRICFSREVGLALKEIKDFNYERIYLREGVKEQRPKLEMIFKFLFSKFKHDIEIRNEKSRIYQDHISLIPSAEYKKLKKAAVIAIDFLAGMTDDYFLRVFKELSLPPEFTTASEYKQKAQASRLP